MTRRLLTTIGLVLAIVLPARADEPAAGNLTATGSMSAPRAAHVSTLLPDSRVLITGGMAQNGVFFASTDLYEPMTGLFMPTTPMSVDRVTHTATSLPDGKVLMVGGLSAGVGPLASAELYDPWTAAFTLTGSLATARNAHTATRLTDGTVLIVGGLGPGLTRLSSAERYDFATGLFRPTGEMTTPRVGHTATSLPDGQVLVTGGSPTTCNEGVLRSAEVYDPTTGAFTPTGLMNVGRQKHAAVLLTGGEVLVVGGSDARDSGGKHASAELYDPTNGTFILTGSMGIARFKIPHALVLLHDGRVLIAGGGDRAEIYDPSTMAFSMVAGAVDRPRQFAAATVLTDGRVLITGGYDENAGPSTPSAWLYEP